MTLTFGSLFAGIGGFDLGFERAGMRCLWQVEINDRCREVLAYHWPDVGRSVIDVTKAGQRNLEPVDVICGGFPCQDLSVAGRREGLAGERSGLWWEFLRVIEELEPKWAVVENVPGLLSSNQGRDMSTLVGSLAECGYRWAYRVVDAQFFGVAQRRRRVFIVAGLGDRRPEEILFERQSSPWDSAPSRETGQELARDVAASLRSRGDGTGTRIDNETGPAVFGASGYSKYKEQEAATAQRSVQYKGTDVDLVVAPTITGNIADGNRKGWAPVNEADALIASTLNSGGNDGGFRTELGEHLVAYGFSQESDGSAVRNAENLARPITGRHGDPGIVAYGVSENQRAEVRLTEYSRQITSGGGKPGQGYPCVMAFDYCLQGSERTFIHRREGYAQLQASRPDTVVGTFGVRRLMPTECERLQGFPDGWTAVNGMKDSPRYRMLGNAVAVPCAEWLGRRIVEARP